MIPESPAPPRWYRVVAALALVWMLIGVSAWVMDLMMDEAALARLSEGQQQLYAARPGWIFVVYGIATFTGLAGAVALLLRKSWAVPALAVSLAAVTIQFGYTLFVMDAVRLIGAAAAIPFPLAIFTIGVLLLWLAITAVNRGWIADSRRAAAAQPAAYR